MKTQSNSSSLRHRAGTTGAVEEAKSSLMKKQSHLCLSHMHAPAIRLEIAANYIKNQLLIMSHDNISPAEACGSPGRSSSFAPVGGASRGRLPSPHSPTQRWTLTQQGGGEEALDKHQGTSCHPSHLLMLL